MLTAKQHWTISRLAYWYLDRGRAAEAEKLARGMLALDQHDGQGWLYYGESRLQQEDLGEAVRGFQQAAQLLGDQPELWMRLGDVLLRLGRVDEARQALQKGRGQVGEGVLRQRIEALLRRCRAI